MRTADPRLGSLLDELLELLGSEPAGAEAALRGLPAELADRADELLDLARTIALVRAPSPPVVPGFALRCELGAGSAGTVWLAHQHGTGRLVALKVLHPHGQSDRARERFLQEARALGRLRHPHLVTVHEVVATDSACAFAAEWIDGPTLQRVLARFHRPDSRRDAEALAAALGAPVGSPAVFFARTGIAIARALGALHREGLVHRDVKPGNVLLRKTGEALLSDLGLVRDAEHSLHTQSGVFVGTTHYAAPEQLAGDDVGPAADIWSLGALLWHAFTGAPPFRGRGVAEQLALARNGALPGWRQHGLPRDLETILAHCLEPDPRARYATDDDLADDLENLLAMRPIRAARAGPATRAARWLRRHGTAVTVLAVLVTGAMLLATWLAQRWAAAATAPARARELVEQARRHLLEPRYEQRVEWVRRGLAPLPAPRHPFVVAAGLYDQALALCDLPAAAAERELLAAVSAGQPTAGQPGALARAGPVTAVALAAWRDHDDWPPLPADDADRRLFGFLAYLVGDTGRCHLAWRGLDLLPGTARDAFVDGALGQVLRDRGDHAEALPRLLRALDSYPAALLAVAVADCACALGQFEIAERHLAAARTLPLQDPWKRELAVAAVLAGARGDHVAAARLFADALAAERPPSTVRHFARWLASRGQAEAAAGAMAMLAAERGEQRDAAMAMGMAEPWWDELDPPARLHTAFAAVGDGEHLLTRLARAHAGRRSGPATGNPSPEPTAASSPGARVPLRAHHLTLEILAMPWQSLCLYRVPQWFRRALAAASVTADGASAAQRWPTVSRALCGAAVFGAAFLANRGEVRAQVEWVQQSPATSPGYRWYFAGAYDPALGFVIHGPGNDTWAYDGTNWAQLFPANAPTIGYQAMAYDAARGSLLMFGGYNGTHYNTTWRLAAGTWQGLAPAQSPPSRAEHCMAYDAARQQVVVFGGSTPGLLNDTWLWNGSNWTQAVTPVAPPARWAPGMMVYDAARQEVVLHGGHDNSADLGDTWVWNGTTWTQRFPTTSPSPARHSGTMVYDPQRQRVVLFGGAHVAPPWLADTWEWDGTNWTQRGSVGATPIGRHSTVLAFHEGIGRVVMFSGAVTGVNLGDTWTYGPTNPATYTAFGSGCASSVGVPTISPLDLAWIGDTMRVRFANLPVGFSYFPFAIVGLSNTAWLLGPLPFDLTLIGMPGCTLLVSTDVIELCLNTGGSAIYQLAIPPNPSLFGAVVHVQGIVSDPAANPFGVAMTRAASLTVGGR